MEDGDTAVDSNSDKNSKSSNGDIVNGDIDDEEGGGGGGGCLKGGGEQVASMES